MPEKNLIRLVRILVRYLPSASPELVPLLVSLESGSVDQPAALILEHDPPPSLTDAAERLIANPHDPAALAALSAAVAALPKVTT